jgi:HK97 gp10 family phage protein
MARTRQTLVVDGLAELRETFKAAQEEANKAAGDAVFAIAELVEGRIFRRLRERSKSGRLSRSLTMRRKQTKDGIAAAEVRGGATAPYMLMREFGTSRTPAAPSITPAVEETRPQMPAIYRELFGQALERRLRGGKRK